MAVEQTTGFTAKPTDPLYTTGKYLRSVFASYTKAGSDKSGTVVPLAKGLPLDVQVVGIRFPRGCAQSANTNDMDIGVYRAGSTVAIDADALVDGLSLHSAALEDGYDALGLNVSGFDYTETLGEILSKETDEAYHGGVDVCMTINTSGTTAAQFDMELLLAFPA
jgi:hypothetical protein